MYPEGFYERPLTHTTRTRSLSEGGAGIQKFLHPRATWRRTGGFKGERLANRRDGNPSQGSSGNRLKTAGLKIEFSTGQIRVVAFVIDTSYLCNPLYPSRKPVAQVFTGLYMTDLRSNITDLRSKANGFAVKNEQLVIVIFGFDSYTPIEDSF